MTKIFRKIFAEVQSQCIVQRLYIEVCYWSDLNETAGIQDDSVSFFDLLRVQTQKGIH